ncbi:MAG TPA: ABC transporter permease subunit [Vicinamibacterales bacterium]|nr:ABC transporter permease subunit [Vicinamibacterales bacterium]
MPIHDQGYRRYAGARLLRARSWSVIARAGIIARLRERRFLALLLVAWLLFVVRAVQIYFGTTFARAAFFAPSEETFHGFLTQQRLFVFFITIYAGAGLIASDRQANALQLYLSKPITRHDYIVGKLATLAAFLIAVTWVPAMMLLMLQVLFSGSLEFVSTHPRLVPAITITAALQVALASMMMLALSSLSRSRRFAAMLYALVTIFAGTIERVLQTATGAAGWVLLSPQNTLLVITDALFGIEPEIPVTIALIAIVTLMAVCVAVLERRVRAVDVVA